MRMLRMSFHMVLLVGNVLAIPADKDNHIINPCKLSLCGENADCRPNEGIPVCSCPSGYKGDPFIKCIKSNSFDASITDPCHSGPCGVNAICKSRGQLAKCSCPAGFDGDPSIICVDMTSPDSHIIDSCKLSICGENADCKQNGRIPICLCPSGYEGDPFKRCIKSNRFDNQIPDPCSLARCGVNADCRSHGQLAKCSCPVGFEGDPSIICVDMTSPESRCGIQSHRGSCATLDTKCPPYLSRQEREERTEIHEAPIESWPWMVLIGYEDLDGKMIFVGAGSLITPKHVMTAAYFFDNEKLSSSGGIARVGEHDLVSLEDCYADKIRYFGSCIPSGVMKDIAIIKVHKHPEYREGCLGICSDIAISELQEKVQLDGRHVQTICLPRNLKEDIGYTFDELSSSDAARTGTIAGWGYGPTLLGDNLLLQTKLQLDKNNVCIAHESKAFNPEINTFFCSACSGSYLGFLSGPLMMSDRLKTKWFVIGIQTSDGSYCGVRGVHHRYTNVAHYIKWIEKIIYNF